MCQDKTQEERLAAIKRVTVVYDEGQGAWVAVAENARNEQVNAMSDTREGAILRLLNRCIPMEAIAANERELRFYDELGKPVIAAPAPFWPEHDEVVRANGKRYRVEFTATELPEEEESLEQQP